MPRLSLAKQFVDEPTQISELRSVENTPVSLGVRIVKKEEIELLPKEEYCCSVATD